MAKKTLAEKLAENSRAVMENLKPNTISSFSSTETIKKNIIILDELKNLIPPLLESEYEALKENMLKFGCKDPLKVWQTTNQTINREGEPTEIVYVLIDGHNRFKLCNELSIPFNIQIDNFESLKDVRDFMIDFQLSRRNITPQQASYLRGLRYNIEKKEVSANLKGTEKSENLPDGQNVHLAKKASKTTAQELGEYFNVDEKTIRRDAEFAHGMSRLEPNFRQEILLGKHKVDKATIQKIGKLYHDEKPIGSLTEIDEIFKSIEVGENTETQSISSHKEKKFLNFNKLLQKAYSQNQINEKEKQKLILAFDDFVNTL